MMNDCTMWSTNVYHLKNAKMELQTIRVTIFIDSSTLKSRWESRMVTRLVSRFLPNVSTRFDSQSLTLDSSYSDFCKIPKHLTNKPSLFAYKESIFFCFCDDQFWRKLFVLIVSPILVLWYICSIKFYT